MLCHYLLSRVGSKWIERLRVRDNNGYMKTLTGERGFMELHDWFRTFPALHSHLFTPPIHLNFLLE